MRHPAFVTAFVIAALCLPGTAGAAKTIRVPEGAAWAPLGTGIATGGTTGGHFEFVRRLAGKKPRRLLSLAARRRQTLAWAVSPALFVAQWTRRGGRGGAAVDGLDLLTGPLGEEPDQLQSCGPVEQPFPWTTIPDPVVDGNTVAAVGGDCRSDRVVVARIIGRLSESRVISAGGRVVGMRVAGDWVAVGTEVDGTLRLSVTNLRSSGAGYAVAVPSQASVVRFAVQQDGTTAFSYWTPLGVPPPREPCRLGWASPADPTVHPLPYPCGALFGLVDGRLLFTDVQGPAVKLLLGDLQPSAPRVVGKAALLNGAHLDGVRIVWGDAGCLGRIVVHLRAIGDQSAPAKPPRCGVRILTRTLRMSRAGMVRIPVSCPGGCRGATVVVIHCAHLACGRYAAFNLPVGGRRTLLYRMSRRACRLIARAPQQVLVKAVAPPGDPRALTRTVRMRHDGGASGPLCSQAVG